jgi:hypothetical protein
MTRKEQTGVRDLTFSGWIRQKLPDSSTGYSVSDLDFVLWNWKTKKIMLIELKTRNSYPRMNQKKMWHNIHKWIKNGIGDGWLYYGFNLIKFENTSFDDGRVWFNKQTVSETELIKILSME